MVDYFKGLVDFNNRPIVKSELRAEQAGPTVRGVRQPFGEHPAAGLTPERLARLLRESIEWNPERYLELAEDMEERDLHYGAVLSVRKRQVAGLPIKVVAAGDDAESVRDADLLREVIARDEFQDELIDILDAIGKGFSASEIIWDTSEKQWMPGAIKFKDPRFFEFDRNDPEKIMLRGESGPEELWANKWILHRAKAKSGLTIRGGIARAVAWTFLFKSFTGKDWAIFCEAYGQPLRLGKYGADATPGDKETLLRAVSSIGADYSAIVPDSMMIEFIKADISGSHELYEKRADWLDRQVSKLVLGQTATTDAIAGGHAVGNVHDRVRDDIEKADARQLSATLTRDLAQPLIYLNHGARKKYPKIIVGRPDEEDIDSLVKNVVRLVPLGLQVGMSTMRDKIGVPEPEPGEELLRAPIAATSPGSPPAAPVPAPKSKNPMGVQRQDDDAIDGAVDDILSDQGWHPLVAPVVDGLEEELGAATSFDEVKAILQRRASTMGVAQLTDMLAKATFAAMLSGQAREDLI